MKNKQKLSIAYAGIAFILGFVFAQITSVVGILIVKIIMQAFNYTSGEIEAFFNTPWGYLLQAIFLDSAFIIMFIWTYVHYLKKQDVLSKPKEGTYFYILICVALGIFTMFALSGVLNYFQKFADLIEKSPNDFPYSLNSTKSYLISLVSLALIPAVCEELFFRGVILNSLKSKGTTFAIIMSSIMFSMFHFSLSQLIYPICFGLILAIVYLKTNNLLYPMLLHFINNALTITIQHFSSSSGEFTHSIGILIYAIVTCALWILAMYYFVKDFKKSTSANNQTTNINSTHIVNQINDSDNNTINSNNINEISTIQSNDINSSINSKEKTNNYIYWGSIILMSVVYIALILI